MLVVPFSSLKASVHIHCNLVNLFCVMMAQVGSSCLCAIFACAHEYVSDCLCACLCTVQMEQGIAAQYECPWYELSFMACTCPAHISRSATFSHSGATHCEHFSTGEQPQRVRVSINVKLYTALHWTLKYCCTSNIASIHHFSRIKYATINKI